MKSILNTPPLHPGEVLREEFMLPHGLTAGKLAQALNVRRDRIEKLSREQTGVSADTALRLGKFFRTGPEFWMNLQKSYELKLAQESADLSGIDPIAA